MSMLNAHYKYTQRVWIEKMVVRDTPAWVEVTHLNMNSASMTSILLAHMMRKKELPDRSFHSALGKLYTAVMYAQAGRKADRWLAQKQRDPIALESAHDLQDDPEMSWELDNPSDVSRDVPVSCTPSVDGDEVGPVIAAMKQTAHMYINARSAGLSNLGARGYNSHTQNAALAAVLIEKHAVHMLFNAVQYHMNVHNWRTVQHKRWHAVMTVMKAWRAGADKDQLIQDVIISSQVATTDGNKRSCSRHQRGRGDSSSWWLNTATEGQHQPALAQR